MANPEHLEVLKQGVKTWNLWRAEYPDVKPNLQNAQCAGLDLSNIDLQSAGLAGADMRRTILLRANLEHADLSYVNGSQATLGDGSLSKASLVMADFHGADFRGTGRRRIIFQGGKFSPVFTGAQFAFANCSLTNFARANLQGSDLSWANLRGTNLTDAIARDAGLVDTNLTRADLAGSDLSGAVCGSTIFAENDLSRIRGLELVRHLSPSIVSVETIYRSHGRIPESFLRGCGLPEDFIAYTHSWGDKCVQFPSCFISYSAKDQGRRIPRRVAELMPGWG